MKVYIAFVCRFGLSDSHLSRSKKLKKKKLREKNAWRTHAFKINYICGDDTILYRQMRSYISVRPFVIADMCGTYINIYMFGFARILLF